MQQPPRLLDQVRQKVRFLHYSRSTEKAYVFWIRRFILFHGKRHPNEMGGEQISAFLNFLANHENVAASTQNQALNALNFLYRRVLNIELDNIADFQYAKKPKRLPVVLTQDETKQVLSQLKEPYTTMVGLMYGAGLRLNECLNLRVLDIDLERMEIIVRHGKGNKDRRTLLPEFIIPGLKKSLENTAQYFQMDQQLGIDHVHLPNALSKKYPNAGKQLKWQYVFASANTSKDPISGKAGRHHIHSRSISRAISKAVNDANIMKHLTAHVFRHSFATHLLEKGVCGL